MLFQDRIPAGLTEDLGSIEVICGPMFSGKTEELLRRLRRARIARVPIAIFKPEIDTRYAALRIVSHDANYFPSLPVKSADQIRKQARDARLVAIDEAQFFDDDLPDVADELAGKGVRVIAAGLDMDYLGRPFRPMPDLMAIADHVSKLSAVCVVCTAPATHSFRKSEDSGLIMLGEKDEYEPRCRRCFRLGGKVTAVSEY